MYCRLIAPDWMMTENPQAPKVLEGNFDESALRKHNAAGYNVYYLPNCPSAYAGGTVDGTHIDQFNYVFVDFDLKSNTYASKEEFIYKLLEFPIIPHRIVDSGNGVHAYWRVSDLDSMTYLRLGRRLMRLFNTDPAIQKIFQLMRLPGYKNTKKKDHQIDCVVLQEFEGSITCEELDALLPPIQPADEQYCKTHYEKTHSVVSSSDINDELPPKFGKLLRENPDVRDLFTKFYDDRSGADFKLGVLLDHNGFTKEEAVQVLVNTTKAAQRAPAHRLSYATNIVDKIWASRANPSLLSSSVEDILNSPAMTAKGERIHCDSRIDNTEYGFRLGHVIGLVAGSGVGKTSFALNMFKWFAQHSPEYHHFFVSLEQPANELAERWKIMCGDNSSLHKKVHIISNYEDDGKFRNLSFKEIKDYLLQWQKATGNKVGCVVIDHIGILKKKNTKDQKQDLISVCDEMKSFAIETNTLLIMQSQTSREKAGIGDLELNKDAAYGTTTFEWYCDYLITMWQPLKRCYTHKECPTVAAYKFCKIRHQKPSKDVIKENVPYTLFFDTETGLLRDMTQVEKQSFDFFLKAATNKRKQDRKTEILTYKSVLPTIAEPTQTKVH